MRDRGNRARSSQSQRITIAAFRVIYSQPMDGRKWRPVAALAAQDDVMWVASLPIILETVNAGPMITLTVNGRQQNWDGDPALPLLWYLRDEVGLTGTKFGCGRGLCGACTVHLQGHAIRSCIATMSDVSGKTIITIEGLDHAGDHPVQKAWRQVNVPQCGYCQSG